MRPNIWLPALAGLVGLASAEDGLDGWLRYDRLPKCHTDGLLDAFPSTIVTLNATKGYPVETAGTELQKGISGILGLDLDLLDSVDDTDSDSPRIIVSTVEAYSAAFGSVPSEAENLISDGFYISAYNDGDDVLLLGSNERAALYAAFEYLSTLAQANFNPISYATNPDAPIRWANQWDNLWQNGTHGSVERGYGGVSIFFDGVGHVRSNLSRVPLYGRLLSSVRVNAIVINNVNADPTIFNERNLNGIEAIADLLRPWGVQLGLSLNFASPKTFGGLDSFDPLDEDVITWWGDLTDEVYRRIPDMAGYLVKANSEGQPGPQEYNRTLAQGANLFAKAVKPHGGIVMFRAFVYDHHADWNDWYADRANDAVKYFIDEDGDFDENVVIQIKYGPIDFQVREPPSPLFSTLRKTTVAIELQVSQEYLGHQCHLVYLPPLWQTILDFDMRVDGEESRVRDILNGKVFDRKRGGGYASVMNVGMNATWLGSHLAMSNLYAFGRIAWEPTADSVDILEDWTRLTFGLSRTVREAITELSMASWPAYESYTGNLGVQTLVDILFTHYGPNPANMDNNGWGQWTRANRHSIGMDRTVSNGTGNAGQYQDEVAVRFEKPETTPDELMLWFHHVPYDFVLHSGKTVIQHFYDEHYDGAETAATFPETWARLKGKIDDERWAHQMHRLEYQAGHAIVWRDSINEFYRNLSGIPDEAGRVRNHPWRIEAEGMTLDGYAPVSVFPTEAASRYKAIVTNTTGTASTTLDDVKSGTYNLAVNYFDVTGGNATWEISLNDDVVGVWAGDAEYKLGKFPSGLLDAHSAIRITFWEVDIEKGDKLTIKGTAHGAEKAALDYISVLPLGKVD